MSLRRRTVPIVVSDHALLRFLARAGGFDPEPLRAVIQDSLARAHGEAQAVGSQKYSIHADGLVYVVAGDVVVTVLPDDRDGRAVR